MATEKLEDEVVQILNHISDKKNFLLSGGAGSGKTYSLVSVINEIYSRNSVAQVACITYTNVAVREIESRVVNSKIRISTVHDFLWDNISAFQKELKATLIESINDPNVKYKNITVDVPYTNDFSEGIQYTEFLRLSDGKISHNEIITLANQMYKVYPKLCDILSSKYDYILVDEYQDTSPEVIEILLEFISKSTNTCIIGLFGDSMQSIYDEGIGDLNQYIESGIVTEVQKKQNRRNPNLVMNLGNALRVDNLKQEPSIDENAPNMQGGKVKEGSIKFLYGDSIPIDTIKNNEVFVDWKFDNPEETKELRLTHNLIATGAGFPSLMQIYDKDPILQLKRGFVKYIKENGIKVDESKTFDEVINSTDWIFSDAVKKVSNRGRKQLEVYLEDSNNVKLYNMVKDKPFSVVKRIYFDKDNLMADKKEMNEDKETQSNRDKLIRHLCKVQSVVELYETKEYDEFIRKTSFSIKRVSDKIEIKEKIDTLTDMKVKTIAEVIDYAHKSGLCIKDDSIENFIEENEYLYRRVSNVEYNEFIYLYKYLEGYAPFSTQHKIKGEEFRNVLVILDNGQWSKYNFEYLLNPTHPKCNPSVLKRTQKLFYVCCTRAMDNLVVYCDNPSLSMLETARKWFGENNCEQICSENLC